MRVTQRQFRSEETGIGPLSTRPLSEQISEAIVGMIASGALRPGQRLIESELAAQCRTSRIPIREAVKTLEKQGILVTTPYRGTRVAEFGALQQAQVTEARIALERLVARQAAAALRAEPGKVETLDRVLGWMGDCVLTGDRFGMNCADVEFHRQMCRIADNAILTTLWSALAQHLLIGFGLSNERYPDSAAVLKQHQGFRKLLLEASPEQLDHAVAEHIGGRDIPPGTA